MLSRWRGSVVSAAVIMTFLLYIRSPFSLHESSQYASPKIPPPLSENGNAKFKWKDVPQRFPVSSVKPVPTIASSTIPRIQHVFKKETSDERRVRLVRLQQVKGNFTHAWKGYKEHAWLRDEVKPISGGSEDPFGGWAASMVDSLGQYCHRKSSFGHL